jgi:VanZ family protein
MEVILPDSDHFCDRRHRSLLSQIFAKPSRAPPRSATSLNDPACPRNRHRRASARCYAWDAGGIAMRADMKSRLRAGAKLCSGVIMILLVLAALGPAKWAPRTELGWQFDHFIGYFGITLFVCIAWPRPLLVGGIIMAVAALLESLQALTPDRSANLEAALWGAAGALAAALVVELFIRAWKWRLKSARAAK